MWLRILAGMALCGLAAASPTMGERESFDLRVMTELRTVTGEGKTLLFYELQLGNFSHDPLELGRIEVLASDGRLLASYAGEALIPRLASTAPGEQAQSRVIASGATAVVYLELSFIPGNEPRSLRHRATFRVADDDADAARVNGADTLIDPRPVTVLGPPLRGGPWAAVFDATWPRGHRRVFYAVEGRATIPGRYAIDFVKLDEYGRLASGDADVVRNAYAYGEEVLAVANAKVVALRNDYPEVDQISLNGRHPLSKGAGNFVILSLEDERYAVYEHLRPGSVRVTLGQQLRRGEVIAEVGFSGSGNWPHLHFHVADAPSLLGAEGLPFAFEEFITLGSYGDFTDLGHKVWSRRADSVTAARSSERPADNSVLRFPD